MKLSRSVSYAVQATLQLAQAEPGRPVPCSQLAATGRMPERFLLQILRNLVTHGILASTRGVDGGYNLDRSLSDISLLDIIEAVEGRLEPNVPTNDSLPDEVQGRLGDALMEVTEMVRRELAAIKLSQWLPPPPKPPTPTEYGPHPQP